MIYTLVITFIFRHGESFELVVYNFLKCLHVKKLISVMTLWSLQSMCVIFYNTVYILKSTHNKFNEEQKLTAIKYYLIYLKLKLVVLSLEVV